MNKRMCDIKMESHLFQFRKEQRKNIQFFVFSEEYKSSFMGVIKCICNEEIKFNETYVYETKCFVI